VERKEREARKGAAIWGEETSGVKEKGALGGAGGYLPTMINYRRWGGTNGGDLCFGFTRKREDTIIFGKKRVRLAIYFYLEDLN